MEKIAEQLAKLKSYFDILPIGVILLNKSGGIVYVNQRGVELYGHKPAPGLEMPLHSLELRMFTPQGRLCPAEELPASRALLTGEEIHGEEMIVERPEGSKVRVGVSASVIKDNEGAVIGAISTLEDMSARERDERGCAEGNERFSMLALATFEGLVISENGVIREANGQFASMYGYTLAEVTGRDIAELFLSEDCERVREAVENGKGIAGEFRAARKDGTVFFVEAQGRPFLRKGRTLFITAVRDISVRRETEEALCKIRDELEARVHRRTRELREANRMLETEIGERRQAEENLKAERQRFYDILETLPVYVLLLTADRHVTFANRFFRERFGDSGGRRCFEFLFNRNAPCEKCETYGVLKTGLSHEWQWTGPDGREYHIYDFPFTQPDGSRVIIEMGVDITEQKLAAETRRTAHVELERRIRERTRALQISEEKYRSLFDNMTEAFSLGEIIYDGEGKPQDIRFTEVNKSWETMIGVPRDRAAGRTYREVIPFVGSDLLEAYAGVALTGESATFETYAGFAGKWFAIYVYSPGPGQCAFIFTDITARKQAEEVLKRDKEIFEKLIRERTGELLKTRLELERAKRLSDIGSLATTVAHELRNPLAAIQMAAANIGRKANNPVLESHLDTIRRKVSESDQIINNLLFYSRVKEPHFGPVAIFEMLEETIAVFHERFRSRSIDFEAAIGPVRKTVIDADALHLKEVFSNILGNAVDAIPQSIKGRITVTAECDARRVVVLVRDNGIGIDREVINRIFDPFFTTKSRGTGLGLSVCWQIVKVHKGGITVDSEPGNGTVVRVELPVKRLQKARPKRA